MRKPAMILLIIALWVILVLGVLALPAFGSFPERGPLLKSVALYYVENGVSQTGAVNIVAAIIWNYRGYDTLGEVTVLFAAVCGVVALLRQEVEP